MARTIAKTDGSRTDGMSAVRRHSTTTQTSEVIRGSNRPLPRFLKQQRTSVALDFAFVMREAIQATVEALGKA